ncbi:dihydrofolate reductase [Brachybacterium sp. P6-10-X1]|uniref:dihydrofolate reductase family protein n=1 Tax=Brachybacterium sp. P6-10-X1 TaxID=1903186 RepID=UPI0009717BE7|nr:dihydrofolate reductase family protein [Brachybacterium sp. P6-10-X1]APX32132.1 dihydrofolate reductase [Brachybacterium sp. P6-10-X1]
MSTVAWGFTCSLDGFITGPDHDMSWLSAAEGIDDVASEQLAGAVGAILSGRRGYDAALAQASERDDLTSEAYGGAWSGVELVLTHRPEELADDPRVIAAGSDGPGIVPLNCDIREAIRLGKDAAGGKDLQIISADLARQALAHDLVDELQIFVAPVFLGDGTRIFDVPGGLRYDWELVGPIEGAERSVGRTYRPRRRRA